MDKTGVKTNGEEQESGVCHICRQGCSTEADTQAFKCGEGEAAVYICNPCYKPLWEFFEKNGLGYPALFELTSMISDRLKAVANAKKK